MKNRICPKLFANPGQRSQKKLVLIIAGALQQRCRMNQFSHSCSVTVGQCTIVTSDCDAPAGRKQLLIGCTITVAKMRKEMNVQRYRPKPLLGKERYNILICKVYFWITLFVLVLESEFSNRANVFCIFFFNKTIS